MWYVDAGNLLAPKTLKGSVRANVNKAHKIVGILNMMGLDFFSPGPSDYLLGVKNLIQMQQKSLFKWVSSNVLDSNGKSLFSRFFIAEKAGLRFAFIGLSPKSKRPRSDIRVLDPVVAIKSILPRITRSADLIILLSQLPYIDNERLARAFPGISLIIGADPNFIYKTPYRITEKTLIVDSDGDGIVLGRLDLQVFLPFRGFYSFSDIRENRERLEFWQTHLKSHPRSKLARDMLRRVEDEGYTEAIENGSMFAGELIKLDEWRFGEKNSVSQRLAE